MQRASYLAISVLLSVPLSVALADHCPEERIAAGTPEHVLAGIDVGDGKIERVRNLYGASSDKQEGTDADYLPGSGYAMYEWKLSGNLLSVDTEFYHDDAGRRVESLVAVTITGAQPHRRFATGRGLRLGDTWVGAQQLYGGKFVRDTVNGLKLAATTMTFCFSDETELEVGLDVKERVVALRLAPSVE